MTDPAGADNVATDLRDEPLDVDVVTSDVAFHGAVWNIRSDTFRYGDGTIVRQYVEHTGAVAVIAIDDDGRVLLIQQYRHPIRTRDWEIPAGLLDVAGEAPVLTAHRELAEEADLAAERMEPLVSTFATPGGSDEVIHIFLARGLSSVDAFDRDDEEADIRLAWVPLADAVDAVLSGRMRNAILAVGVLAAAEHLRRESGGTV